MRPLIYLFILQLAIACDMPDDTGPQTVRIFAINPDTQSYELFDAQLSTLESARQIRGGAAEMRGGGSLTIETALLSGDLTPSSNEEARKADIIKGDGPVEAEYIKDNDVLVPTDWESLAMFSFYYQVEKAHIYYREIGTPEEALPALQAHFNIQFSSIILFGQVIIADNAAYMPIADSFLLFPQNLLNDGVPLALNQGVVTHELSHSIKHHIVHGDGRLPRPLLEEWPAGAANAYSSDDEGLADFFAAVFTADPDFILPSIDSDLLDRDISVERIFTDQLYTNMGFDLLGYNPYELGSVLASWLWAIAGDDLIGRKEVARVVMASLVELEPDWGPDYDLTQLIDMITSNLTGELQDSACDLLEQRLEGSFRRVPTCGISL